MNKTEFEKVVIEYGNDLLKFCCYLTLNKDLASELYQETFLRVFQKGNDFENSNNKKSFMLGIATNIWRNQISKKTRRNKIAPIVNYDEYKDQFKDNKSEMLDEYIEKELIREIKNAVDGLPDKQRVVILLHYMENVPTSDIAGMLHIPKGTVLSRLAKARESLRKEMEARGYEI